MAESTEQRDIRLLREAFERLVEELAAALTVGEITLIEWQIAMSAAIRDFHLAAAVIANGGVELPDEMTVAAREAAEFDLSFLTTWVAKLAATTITIAAFNRISARAKLYARSIIATWERAQDINVGIPTLPFYPKQDTICKRNCKCTWRRERLQGRNNWDVTWILAIAEHCTTCEARARAANPLQVRSGQILNPERYSSSILFA